MLLLRHWRCVVVQTPMAGSQQAGKVGYMPLQPLQMEPLLPVQVSNILTQSICTVEMGRESGIPPRGHCSEPNRKGRTDRLYKSCGLLAPDQK